MIESTTPLVTKSELARRLGVSEQTIRRWSKSGVIPSIRVNRQVVRFRFDDVMRALESRTRDCPGREGDGG